MANRIDDMLGQLWQAPSIETKQQNESQHQARFEILYALPYAVAAIGALVGILGLF
jgi:hypothetical protein